MGQADYREHPAPPGLGLACVWSQSVSGDAEPYAQRVVPDACIDLILADWEGEIHVAGPDTRPFFADIPPGGSLFGVRFRPGMAAPALGLPADALRDDRVPLRELWGGAADALADAAAVDADPAAVLARAVAVRLRSADPPDPIVSPLVAALAPEMYGSAVQPTAPNERVASHRPSAASHEIVLGGEVSVRTAATRLGISERQLRRRSLAVFGYGPKTLQRVLRFQRALTLARAGGSLAAVAYDTGYADQAHLAHDVRDLAGVPLTDLLGPDAAGAAAP
ncbi:MAG TPA: helix-turn-helix domain-containing protein [Streptosporangiaceae bacterium]|jgi:AraC-like DNA-binding protein